MEILSIKFRSTDFAYLIIIALLLVAVQDVIEDELDGVGLIHLVERLLASHLAVLWYITNGTTKDDLLYSIYYMYQLNRD